MFSLYKFLTSLIISKNDFTEIKSEQPHTISLPHFFRFASIL